MFDSYITNMKVQDPSILMETLLNEIKQEFDSMCHRTGMTFESFRTRLYFQDESTARRLDDLWRKIDCGIYGDYQSGRMSEDGFLSWQTALITWRQYLLNAVSEMVREDTPNIHDIDPLPAYDEAA